MELREIDPVSTPEPLLRAAAEVEQLVALEHDPDVPPRAYEGVLGWWVHGEGAARQRLVVAVDGDQVLGVLLVVLHVRDNVDAAVVEISVHPSCRRRGVGSALLERALTMSREESRSRLLVSARGAGPGAAFLAARGFAEVLMERRRVCVLADVPPPGPVPEGYEVVRWTGAAPDDLVEAYAALKRSMADAPMQDLSWSEDHWDVEEVRALEAAHAARGVQRFVAVVREVVTGELAALTEVVVDGSRPHRAEQWDTIVAGAHRGRGLGFLVKADLAQVVRAARPEVVDVETTNASDNPWMIEINERLGYRLVDTWSEWERPVVEAG